MNGAESLARTLLAQGVDVCFANPGTSEMHFVAALDKVDGMRCVLGLFEGVVTAAADGYYRMTGKPACTLLHLGPGLGNGLANLHNAKKAGSGIVNVVGEHAVYHVAHNAPLTSDIEGIARPMSHWVHTCPRSQDIARAGALAVQAARQAPGQIATLILPADTAWGEGGEVVPALQAPVRNRVPASQIGAIAQLLKSKGQSKTALLLGGMAGQEQCLEWAGRIAAHTGCDLLCEYSVAKLDRGAGRVQVRRIPYSVDLAVKLLADYENIVLVGAREPVAFFAYPGKPSLLAPSSCVFGKLGGLEDDLQTALIDLASALGAEHTEPTQRAELKLPPLPAADAPIEPMGLGQLLANCIPANAVVIDEAISSGRGFDVPTSQAPAHTWLNIMGGAIGFGLPGSVGVAIGLQSMGQDQSRPVLVLEGDGSGMYTLQSLWTMAREQLNIKVLILANHSYNILQGELKNVGAGEPGVNARSMLTLNSPQLNWVQLANGHGVPAERVSTLGELHQAFQTALAKPGPYLIEAVM